MAISETMEKKINEQINAELYSAYLYLSMSCQAQDMNLKGFANWFYIQYQEEVAHAMGLLNYVHDRGGKVTLTTIEAPKTKWESAVEMFEDTCKHEAHVTSLINDLAIQAMEEKDFAAVHFFSWYVKEQVEEEASAGEICGEVKLAQNAPGAMLMLDRELGARTFVAPVIK